MKERQRRDKREKAKQSKGLIDGKPMTMAKVCPLSKSAATGATPSCLEWW